MNLAILRSVFLLLAASLALSRTKNKWLRAYFIFQIIADIIGPVTLLCPRFYHFYPFFFIIIIFFVLTISGCYVFQHYRLECFTNRFYAAIECLMLPSFVVAMTAFSLRMFLPSLPLSIALCEGAALLALGVALAVTTHGDPVAKILSGLWLSLAGWEFSFSYGLVLAHPTFVWLNTWLPATLVTSAFLLIFREGKFSGH